MSQSHQRPLHNRSQLFVVKHTRQFLPRIPFNTEIQGPNYNGRTIPLINHKITREHFISPSPDRGNMICIDTRDSDLIATYSQMISLAPIRFPIYIVFPTGLTYKLVPVLPSTQIRDLIPDLFFWTFNLHHACY